jgi:15-cis-phytoene synthase
MPQTSLEESYRLCESLARKSSFYAGFRFLPIEKHRALSAIYGFMRHCDDISDGPGTFEEKQSKFQDWRLQLKTALSDGSDSHPLLPALRDTIQAFRIPTDYFYGLIEGTEMDLRVTSYDTFEALYRYCYHVASVVGFICIHIFGFEDPRALKHAESCGIAFQLTNILRDIREDLGRGRLYLPNEDLEKFGVAISDLGSSPANPGKFRELLNYEIDRAVQYYDSAAPLASLLARDSRAAFQVMYQSYRRLLMRIRESGLGVLNKRVRLGILDKGWILIRTLTRW